MTAESITGLDEELSIQSHRRGFAGGEAATASYFIGDIRAVQGKRALSPWVAAIVQQDVRKGCFLS
jgi:hypothetical protein